MDSFSKKTERIQGNEYRNFIVCVDSVNGGIIGGSYYSPYLPGSTGFSCLSDLIFGMEGLMNEMGNVKHWYKIASFTEKKDMKKNSTDGEVYMQGRIATFSIRILFRRNASWQGSVKWIEGRTERNFRSVLELLLLIDSACSDSIGVKK